VCVLFPLAQCVEIVTHDDTHNILFTDCLYIRFYLGEASKEEGRRKEAMTNAKRNARVDSMFHKMSACLLDDFFKKRPILGADTTRSTRKSPPSSRPNGVIAPRIASIESLDHLRQKCLIKTCKFIQRLRPWPSRCYPPGTVVLP